MPAAVLPSDTAAISGILVRFIRTALHTLKAAGLSVAAGAFLTGAVQGGRADPPQRRTVGRQTGPVGTWTHVHGKCCASARVALAP